MPELEDNNLVTSSTHQHHKKLLLNLVLPKTLPNNNFLTTLELDLPREVPEVSLLLEENLRLLMITDPTLLIKPSSRNACMTSELV